MTLSLDEHLQIVVSRLKTIDRNMFSPMLVFSTTQVIQFGRTSTDSGKCANTKLVLYV